MGGMSNANASERVVVPSGRGRRICGSGYGGYGAFRVGHPVSRDSYRRPPRPRACRTYAYITPELLEWQQPRYLYQRWGC